VNPAEHRNLPVRSALTEIPCVTTILKERHFITKEHQKALIASKKKDPLELCELAKIKGYINDKHAIDIVLCDIAILTAEGATKDIKQMSKGAMIAINPENHANISYTGKGRGEAALNAANLGKMLVLMAYKLGGVDIAKEVTPGVIKAEQMTKRIVNGESATSIEAQQQEIEETLERLGLHEHDIIRQLSLLSNYCPSEGPKKSWATRHSRYKPQHNR